MDKGQISKLSFDKISHFTDDGVEFWYARELQSTLGYSQWRRFLETIERAKISCKNSGIDPSEHFADVGKTSPMPNGGKREIGDIMLPSDE